MRFGVCTGVLLVTCLASGCSGGGGASGGGGGTGSNPTPDMGTLTAMNDSFTYTLTNGASGMVLGISGQSQIAGTNVVQEAAGTITPDIDWHFLPMNNNQYNMENMLTHQVMGVTNASTSAGAQILAVGRQRHRRPPMGVLSA